MSVSDIIVRGARQNNLRGIDLVLPRGRLICLTGVSGSGKSSLAFDTLYAEGQRRYVESLSGFARQFLGQMPKPDIDRLDGLSPAISIAQKTAGSNPRSTVGTITEIHDYLRVLYARTGIGYCPECGRRITSQSRQQILMRIEQFASGTPVQILAPLIRGQKGSFADLFRSLLKQGFVRARADGEVIRLDDTNVQLDRQMRHTIEVVVDRLTIGPENSSRLAGAVELALKLGDGNLIVIVSTEVAGKKKIGSAGVSRKAGSKKSVVSEAMETSFETLPATAQEVTTEIPFSAHYACPHCELSFQPPTPQMFSFNSPQGMCPKCAGIGEVYGFEPSLLIANPSRSFQQGVIELVGGWKEMGRWRRHIYRGVAEHIEKQYSLASGTVLETAWEELPEAARHDLLHGTGDAHITYTWRGGSSGYKWGGTFDGILPQLLEQYRTTKSAPQRHAFEKYMSVVTCDACHGKRLNLQACAVRLRSASLDTELSLPDLSHHTITDAIRFFESLEQSDSDRRIGEEAVREIRSRLGFLRNVGLDYLTLDRTAPTLSGGEMQRIRLASQIGCGLTGVLYILDEPSIGLHARDNRKLIDTLCSLRDQGNTVVVVEHDEETMRAADWLVDFGPGPGVHGGRVVAEGPIENVLQSVESRTADFLAGRYRIPIPPRRPVISGEGSSAKDALTPTLTVRGARHNNLKGIDVRIPLGRFVCVTGVSGSGKSSLVTDILAEVLNRELNGGLGHPGAYDLIEGLCQLDKMIAIDQSPIGRTPRSNPATYIKLLDEIRNLYARLPEAKLRGYLPGRFSFNVPGGRCEACEGNGATKLDMDFLADVWVPCPVCEGRRFNHETLQVRFHGRSIADVLDMDVQEAMELFENIPSVIHRLRTLHDVGMDYVKLGQPSPTLSGGEAQRVRLAKELAKIQTGRTFYILDEPTTGLHFADVEMLLAVLRRLVDAGNTVLVVEHNQEVMKTADWIIDLGPEGGEGGGRIVAEGTPEQIAVAKDSYTGAALADYLAHERALMESASDAASEKTSKRKRGGKIAEPVAKTRSVVSAADVSMNVAKPIVVRGARQNNLRNVDVTIPGRQMTVFCGPSGSGKSSMAMETIYAEGQRRYVESLSAYARQFVDQMEKPKLEHIEGLSPAIAIEQKRASATPRSTVGTVTEIHDYLRILMARLGTQFCPDCGIAVGTQTTDEITDRIMTLPSGTRLVLAASLDSEIVRKDENFYEDLRSQGYQRIRVDGVTLGVDESPKLDRRRRHEIEVVVDRVVVRTDARGRIAESVESAVSLGRGTLRILYPEEGVEERRWRTETASVHCVCPQCNRSFGKLSPRNFSFNSSLGWCPACEGLGVQTGASTELFLVGPRLTLAEGAIRLFPGPDSSLLRPILEAFRQGCGCPIDIPFEQLGSRWRRMILHGTGDMWFTVTASMLGELALPAKNVSVDGVSDPVRFRFRYRGVYPSLEEAGRLSVSVREITSQAVGETECSVCAGSRLQADASAVQIFGRTLDDLCRMPLAALLADLESWTLDDVQRKVAGELFEEITGRLRFLLDVGLDYLTLGRAAPTLSGGESQRIRLASQLGSGLVGVLYVLDEPTIGLHPRDSARLIAALQKLKELGNTLLLVEHDREVIAAADQLLDFGPAAGAGGGEIVACGAPEEVKRIATSVTGPWLSGERRIPIPTRRRVASVHTPGIDVVHPIRENVYESIPTPGGGWLTVAGASQHNLQRINVPIPLGAMTVVTGVSGSGKSSLVMDILYPALARSLHRAMMVPGDHEAIFGTELVNKVICVDQQSIGQTPTSNPATFTGVFDLIRDFYAKLPDSRIRGFTARRFSFNVPGGRCEKCEGNGRQKIAMHFLPDVWVTCEACGGKRYEPETLSVKYHDRSIADVLEMSIIDALGLFQNIAPVRRILQTLCDVGLGYLTLGHPAPDLSGGESQRVRLAAELSRPDTGRTLYLLDEPTTGLHFTDLEKLLDTLNRLVALGNTVVVIEHNLDLIKTADWIVELGPEAGLGGGRVVAIGTPEDIVEHARFERFIHANDLPNAASSKMAPVTIATTMTAVAKSRRKAASKKTVGTVASEKTTSRKKMVEPIGRSADPRAVANHSRSGGADDEKVENGSVADPDPLRSYTGESLIPLFTDAVFADPKTYSTPDADTTRKSASERQVPRGIPLSTIMTDDGGAVFVPDAAVKGSVEGDGVDVDADPDIEVKMPWELDGRTWHTRTRISRNGKPCRWDGRILAELVDRIESAGGFSPTDWRQRTTVETRSEKKSEGWFFHAITGEEWLLKLKFRVARGTFRKDLVERLQLPSLNDTPEIPLYGRDPRTRIQTVGAWQEIELRVCEYMELDRPEYHEFVDQAIAGFHRICDRQRENPKELTPWKQLGELWHRNPRGFPVGRRCAWDHEALGKLIDLVRSLCPEGRWNWTNRTMVPIHIDPPNSPGGGGKMNSREKMNSGEKANTVGGAGDGEDGDDSVGGRYPWACIHTKRPEALYLVLSGRKGAFARGKIHTLPGVPELDDTHSDVDRIRFTFMETVDLRRRDLRQFIEEHLAEELRIRS